MNVMRSESVNSDVTTSGLVLFACSGLLLSLGSILSVATSFSLYRMSFFFWTSDVNLDLSTGMLVVAGSALCLPICWIATVIPCLPRKISVHAALMCMVLAALTLLTGGMSSVAGLGRSMQDPARFNASMHRAMARGASDINIRSSFDDMQLELQCCGIDSHTDWYLYRSKLPAACCAVSANSPTDDVCEDPKFIRGCFRVSLKQLHYFCNTSTVLGYAIICVLIVTLTTSTYILVCNEVAKEKWTLVKDVSLLQLPLFAPLSAPVIMPVEPPTSDIKVV